MKSVTIRSMFSAFVPRHAAVPYAFALVAVVLLGMAAAGLLTLSMHRIQTQSLRERTMRATLLATSIATQFATTIDLGIEMRQLVGVAPFLDERRRVGRLRSVQLRDSARRVLASAGEPIDPHRDGLGEAVVRDAAGVPVGYVDVVLEGDPGAFVTTRRMLTLLIAALSAVAFASEALRYAWRSGPVLRRDVVARASALLQAENYTQIWMGAGTRRWDRRPQRLAALVRRIDEHWLRLQRLLHSLLRTEPDPSRRAAWKALQAQAVGTARLAVSAPTTRRLVAAVDQARWLMIISGTAVGGAMRLLIAPGREPYAAGSWASAVAAAPDAHILAGTAASPLAYRTLWLAGCLLAGWALASRARLAPRATAGQRAVAACCALAGLAVAGAFLRPNGPSVVAALLTSWRAGLIDALFAATLGLALGTLLTACSNALHAARRDRAFSLAGAPLDDAWLGALLGLLWFGPLLVEVLSAALPSMAVIAVLVSFAVSGVILLRRCGGDLSPWRAVTPHGARGTLHVRDRCAAFSAGVSLTAWLLTTSGMPSSTVADPASNLSSYAAVGTGALLGACLVRAASVRRKGKLLAPTPARGRMSMPTRMPISVPMSMPIRMSMPLAVLGAALLVASWSSRDGDAIGWSSLVPLAAAAWSAALWIRLGAAGQAPSRHLPTVCLTLLAIALLLMPLAPFGGASLLCARLVALDCGISGAGLSHGLWGIAGIAFCASGIGRRQHAP